uniref:TELO2 interacting protein 2 n=1 Tax=Callorhinchus milii TaxID=7868 RepID=A0A4W3HZF2_CALMI
MCVILPRETGKLNPASGRVLCWVLERARSPALSLHLDAALPPALLLSDDYRTNNKVLGVRCLQHIIVNVPPAELLQYNRAQVLYHALYNHLYTHEVSLVQAVLPCLLALLPVLEGPPDPGKPRAPGPSDDTLRLILTHMEAEDKIPLRRVYASHLPTFTARLGITVLRHWKRLQRVILGYLEVDDGSSDEAARLGVLRTLETVIQQAWPRSVSTDAGLGPLLRALLRLVLDVCEGGSEAAGSREQLLQSATRCVCLLHHCSSDTVPVSAAPVCLSLSLHSSLLLLQLLTVCVCVCVCVAFSWC